MTLHLADIASYQGALTLDALDGAGFRGINVKVSHGLTQKSVHPDVRLHVQDARSRGWALSSFHWLDNSADGAFQAEYAYACLSALGLTEGAAHVVDCEADARYDTYARYCDTMMSLLGRPIVTYTGDWWWLPRAWQPAAASRWLHSAPAAGYLPEYPGDESAFWTGYGGWPELAIMQYRVAPIAGIKVSQSAVRSMDLWREMAGMAPVYSVPASTALVNEFNAISPKRDKASDGTIGNLAHAESTSDHNLDETGNTGGVEDNDDIDEVHARDVDDSGPWPAGWTMEKFVQLVLARCRSGREKRLRYVIYNSRIWRKSNGWKQEAYAGPNPHDKHAHFSFEYGSGASASNPENITSPYGILEAVTDMPLDAADKTYLTGTLVPAIAKAVSGIKVRDTDRDLSTVLSDLFAGEQRATSVIAETTSTYRQKQLSRLEQAAAVLAGKVDALALSVGALNLIDTTELARLILAGLPAGTLTKEDVAAVVAVSTEEAVRNVLRSGTDG